MRRYKGMAFLSQYRIARRRTGEHVQPEIEFNFGRAFQQLGARVDDAVGVNEDIA